ncbi:group III truncated hemoglobin [Cytophaga sp. FL35]|uniref:group III truncated hemoglobin n=1 Tax=Cytophaga sp. FL35 TaxID=1904456 RepID=UPI001653A0A6|nr:group III truncated hemoglobin [Cytophaga sp. FL35]MBC6997249.1 group III truncated hemoglobin [Cytophaga sp. FL35]
MGKKLLRNRKDVHLLVTHFYGKIREHATLGPIFNIIIEDWDAHFEVLTNFWESQLFLKRNYHNNPIKVHNEVDKKMEHMIKSEHFGMWLNLWFETLDELFEGEVAYIAKNRAQKMSSMLFIEMFKARPK